MAQTYNASDIEVLSGLDPVRRRPGMYTDTSRPNHLAHEVVDNSVDGGPIIVQRPVPVLDADTADTLAERILVEEHIAYPEAVRVVLAGGWRLDGRRFIRPGNAAST